MRTVNGVQENLQVQRFFPQAHRPFVSVLMLFAMARILTGLFLSSGANSLLHFDTVHYWSQARWSAAGAYPYLDYWVEYPPVFPWLAVAAYKLSLLMPPWQDRMIWFSQSLHLLLLPFEVGCLALIYALACRLYNIETALRCALIYALLFVPLVVSLGFFDVLPLFFLLLGLYAMLRGWPVVVGVATGLGFLSKVIPLVVLPAAWKYLCARSQRVGLVLSFVAVVMLVLVPLLAANPTMTWASFRAQGSRASYGTIWALVEGYHSFGLVSYERFDPVAADWQPHESTLPFGWITAGWGIAALALYCVWRDKSPRRVVAFVGLTLTGLMLWSKGFSPQWMIYQVPFVILMMPDLLGTVYLVALDILTISEWGVLSLSGIQPGLILAGNPVGFIDAGIILHTVLLALLGWEYGRRVWPSRGRWTVVVRRGVYIALAALLVAQGTLWIAGIRSYSNMRAQSEPHAALMADIRTRAGSQTGIVFPQQLVMERLVSLSRGIDVHWAATWGRDADSWQNDQLIAFVENHPDLWVVTDLGGEQPDQGIQVENWLCGRYGLVSRTWVGSAQVARFVTSCASNRVPQLVYFGEQILLEGVALGAQPQVGLCVSLDWSSQGDVDRDYVVMVHLLDSAGQLVAQNDQPPVAGLSPTSQWRGGMRIRDRHGLSLADSLAPGSYRLVIGVYAAADGMRLPVSGCADADSNVCLVADVLVQPSRLDIHLVENGQ